MTLPTRTTPTTAQPDPFSVIAKKHRDGSVLLSTASDRVFKLNGVGALTWLVLEQSPTGVTAEQVVHELSRRFDVINASGDSLYDVPPEKLWEDTVRFLENLTDMLLVDVTPDSDKQKLFRIREGVSGTTSATVADLARKDFTGEVDHTAIGKARHSENEASSPQRKPLKRETVAAFFGLLAFDLMLRLAGFQSLITKVERWPISKPHSVDFEICRRVRAMVDRAQLYYPKKAMCLQHSAVVTCLLRRRGLPAQMVLAARDFPPKGHAWVEVEGEVVNDKPAVQEIYRTLRRV